MEFVHQHHSYPDGDRVFYAIPSPQAGADSWGAGVGGAQTKWSTAIQNTTKDPGALAVQQQSALLANFTNAVTSGEWARRVTARGATYWKSRSVAAASTYGASGNLNKDKYLAAAQQLYPYESQLQSQVDGMPKGTRSDSLARFTAWMDGMIAFKQQYQP